MGTAIAYRQGGCGHVTLAIGVRQVVEHFVEGKTKQPVVSGLPTQLAGRTLKHFGRVTCTTWHSTYKALIITNIGRCGALGSAVQIFLSNSALITCAGSREIKECLREEKLMTAARSTVVAELLDSASDQPASGHTVNFILLASIWAQIYPSLETASLCGLKRGIHATTIFLHPDCVGKHST